MHLGIPRRNTVGTHWSQNPLSSITWHPHTLTSTAALRLGTTSSSKAGMDITGGGGGSRPDPPTPPHPTPWSQKRSRYLVTKKNSDLKPAVLGGPQPAQASKGQVWIRHFAPATPAFTQPSSPSQYIACSTGQQMFHGPRGLLPVPVGFGGRVGDMQRGRGGDTTTHMTGTEPCGCNIAFVIHCHHSL